MNSNSADMTLRTKPASRPGRRWLRRLLAPFANAREGVLTLYMPDGERLDFGRDAGRDSGRSTGLLHATVTIHRWRALRRALTGGSLGWAESYLDGDWDSADITALVRWILHNEEYIGGFLEGGWLKRFVMRLRHRRNANSRRGSRRNIAFHYDLGNDFYRHWLDSSMTYSSALFSGPEESLEKAQRRKYEYILERLPLRPGDRVLEIGCGWGGFAEQLCRHSEARLEGITLSKEQLDYARARIERAGFAGRAQFSLTDYRDTEGVYDHIVSIEMLEAVGREYWEGYFQTLMQRLKPGGTAAIQVITIDEARFEGYCETPDFIQTYIFPGGMLPSIERLRDQADKAGLTWKHALAFGDSYARTLRHWNQAFHAAWDNIAPLGFDERFKRLWRYYLEYCEGGFLAGSIGVYQIFLEKPPAVSG